MSIMKDPTMNIPMEELELILAGISDDGKISKEAEKALLARIEEGKAETAEMQARSCRGQKDC